MVAVRDMFSKDLLSATKRVVGLDVGSSLIKLVEIRDSKQRFQLKNYAQISVPPGIIVDGVVKDETALSERIKELFKNSKCGLKHVVSALSGHTVIIKKVNFAMMNEEELRELLSDEAENYLPFDDVSEVNFDFYVIGENELNPNQMEVIITAAKKEIIESCTRIIERAGRRVAIVDVDSFALETAYNENYDFSDDEIVALVHMGASITNINIVKGGGSVFTRNFSLGGNSITEAVQKKLQVPFEEAERIKIEKKEDNGISPEELIIYAEPIFAEIERSVDYFSSTFMDPFIKKILVSGGCAKIPGIVEAIEERLRCEAELFDPFQNIGYDKKVFKNSFITDIGPTAVLGVGLALRRMDDK